MIISALIRHNTLVICLVSMVCYLVSLWADFVFDDTEAIVNNKDVMNDTNVSQVFADDFWGTPMTHNSSHKSYRPLTVLAMRLIRLTDQLIGHNHNQVNPHLYHFSNIVLYGAFNCLLFNVLLHLLDTFVTKCDQMNERNAFMVTIMFICHPIHTESVCACVGLADLLSSLMALFALKLYLQCNQTLNYINLQFIMNSILITSLSGIAMLFKEQGITFMGLCLILDIILLTDRKCNINPKLLIIRVIMLSLGTFLLLMLRLVIMDFRGPQFQKGDNPSSFEDSLYIRLINYNYIYAINAWILLYPDWLCFDWSMTCIPLIKSMSDLRIIFILIFWVTLLLIIKASVFHKDYYIGRQLQISIALGCVPFAPSANIFFTVGFVVAERALFLPSIGYILLIVTGINTLEKRFANYSKILKIFTIFLIIVFMIRTFRRNFDWINEKRLFESGLSVCPLNAKVHYNIAKNAADFGFKDKAISEYREAIRLNADYEQAFNNLANILKDSGNLQESKQLLLNAVRIRPNFATAWMNLGIVETALKQHKEAEISYLNAIKYRNRYADCYYNLGNLYVQQNRFDEAYRMWRTATQLKPHLLSAFNNQILMFDNIGSHEKAYHIALEALEYHPNESSVHFNLANVLGKMSQFNESEMHFKKAISLSPQNANYYSNLGVLYHRWKHYPKALIYYEMALKLDPNLESARKNINFLNRILNN